MDASGWIFFGSTRIRAEFNNIRATKVAQPNTGSSKTEWPTMLYYDPLSYPLLFYNFLVICPAVKDVRLQ